MSQMHRPLPTASNANLAYLANRASLPVLSTLLVQAAVTWAKWRMMHRTRLTLDQLDPHLLRDIGVSREQASQEAARPFWQ